MIFRFIALLMTGYFFWATDMQRNDPDATWWLAIYGAMTVISALAIFKIKFSKIYLVLAVVIFLYGASLFPYDQIDHKNLMNDEVAREAIGLLICSIWLVVVGRPRFF